MGFAPFADPEFDGLIIGLAMMCGLIAALGIVYVLQSFNRAIFGGLAKMLGEIPYLGDTLASPINDVYKWMDHEFGAAITYLDGRVAYYFRHMVKLVEWFGQEIENHANLLYAIASFLAGIPSFGALNSLRKDLEKLVRSAVGYAENEAERVFGKARAGIDALIGSLTKRLHVIEHAVSHALTSAEKWAKAKVNGLEHDFTHLKKRIEALEKRWAKKAFLAAVGAALAELGLSWLHCSNVKKFGRAVCQNDLDTILGLLGIGLAIAGTFDLETLAKDVQAGVSAADSEIRAFWSADVKPAVKDRQLGSAT